MRWSSVGPINPLTPSRTFDSEMFPSPDSATSFLVSPGTGARFENAPMMRSAKLDGLLIVGCCEGSNGTFSGSVSLMSQSLFPNARDPGPATASRTIFPTSNACAASSRMEASRMLFANASEPGPTAAARIWFVVSAACLATSGDAVGVVESGDA